MTHGPERTDRSALPRPRRPRPLLRVAAAGGAMLLVLSTLGGLVQLVGTQVAAAAAPTITQSGFAEYSASAHATTITSGSNGAALPQGTIDVTSTAGFDSNDESLTVQTSSGYEEVFCSGTDTATTFTTCTGGAGTMSTGGYVTSAALNQFNVYTLVSGGEASIDPSSLTVVTDVPGADRGAPSTVTANTSDGLVNYLQSASPSGSFSLTFGICAAGTATYSSTSTNCTTGVITYASGTSQDLGDTVSVLGMNEYIYEPLSLAVDAPSVVTPGQTSTIYVAPAATQVPAAQTAYLGTTPITVTVDSASALTAIAPIPAGSTVQSVALIGGDATTSGKATITICTASSSSCTANLTGNYSDTTYPYVELSLPSNISVPGGTSVTMPTIAVTLKATGAAGTVLHTTLTEFLLDLSLTIIVPVSVDFDGYPTTGDDTSSAPPAAPATPLSTTTIMNTQTVSFTSSAPADAVVGGTYTPTATATSGLTPTITVDSTSSSVCAISSGVVTFTAVGTCTLDANQAGNGSNQPAPQVQQSFSVGQASQTVSFTSTAPADASLGGATYMPTASATSGLTPAITVDPSASGVCAIASGVVSFIGTGTCILDANQAGNANYLAAPQVQQSFTVGRELQTVSFTSPAPVSAVYGGATYTPSATASSGLTPTITVDDSSSGVCAISGGVVSFVGAGTCTLDANQSGDSSFAAAPQVQQSFSVGKASQTVSFTSTAPVAAVVGGAYTPLAIASSGLTPTITVDPSSAGVCSISEGLVSFTGAGTCTLDANQAGNADYAVASQAQQDFSVGQDSQTVSFTSTPPGDASYQGATYTPSASATSGLTPTITVDASASSVCAISGGAVSFIGVGTCTLDANQAGDTDYSAATQVQQSFAVGQASQSVTFTSTAPSGAVVGGTYTPSATASSGLTPAITVDGSSAGVCTISGGVVSLSGTGICTLDANQTGSTDYAAAPQVQQSFTVSSAGKTDQTVSFTSVAPISAVYDGTTYTPSASATSGLTPTITVDPSSSSVCAISGGAVSFTGAGTCTLDANQAGDATYNPAPQVQQSFTVAQASQTVSFTSTAPDSATYGGTTYTPSATASSGLTAAITVDASSSSVCALSAGTVSFTGVGTCTLDANQAGDTDYSAATQVQQSFSVAQASQTVSFTSTAPGSATYGGATYTPSATASSGLTAAITVDDSSSSVCALSAGVVSFTGVGTCTLDANQAGDSDYSVATQVQQSFSVAQASQTVSFTSTAPSGAVVGGTYAPSATATSGLTAAITVDASSSSVCAISAGTVTFEAAGTCTLDADQAGNADYAAAAEAQQAISVGLESQTISFTSTAPAAAVFGGATYTPTASATSGLTVSITVDASSSSVCAITAGVVSFTGTGACTLDANQAGNDSFAAATQVEQSFSVGKASQTVSFTSTAPSDAAIGGTYTPSADATSGLTAAITVDSSSSSVCAISAGVVSFTTAGTCTLDANQAGNTDFEAAGQVQQSFTVSTASVPAPTISAVSPATGTTNGGTLVTITGTGFTGTTVVDFGTTAATSIVVSSDTTIVATTPAGSAGPVDVSVTAPGGTATDPGAFTYSISAYSAVTPLRICDTRAGNPSQLSGPAAQCGGSGGSGETLSPGTPLDVQVSTNPADFGVPADATAVVLNVTAVNASAAGYLTVYPAGVLAPTASNLNFTPGTSVPNLVETGLGSSGASSGEISVVSNQHVDVVIDLEGYVAPTAAGSPVGAGLYDPLASPARICDTRAGNPSQLSGGAAQCEGKTLTAASPLDVQVTGNGEVPASGVSAVVLNVTVVGPVAKGYLTAYPADAPGAPTASNLNYAAGQTVANRVIVPVSASGQVALVANQPTDALVDVSGYYTAAGDSSTGTQYAALSAPVRVCDTRAGNPSGLSGVNAQCNGPGGTGTAGTTLSAGGTITVNVAGLDGVPSGASAVVLNLTAIHPSAQTHLTVYPGGGTLPDVSDLNPAAGSVRANLVVATVGTNGTITIANYAGTVDLAVDVAGFYQ